MAHMLMEYPAEELELTFAQICPAEIVVAGRPWTIEFVNETRLHELSPIDANALSFGQTLKIFIGDFVHPHLQRELVLHEVMHACVYGGQFDGKMEADTDPEEWMISGLDSPLLTTLRDNPALVAYLMG